MADFQTLRQQADQNDADFQKTVAALIGKGYRSVSGYADPEGKASWVMLEKINQSLASGAGDKRLIQE